MKPSPIFEAVQQLLRYRNADGSALFYAEIARELGLSRERIRQIASALGENGRKRSNEIKAITACGGVK